MSTMDKLDKEIKSDFWDIQCKIDILYEEYAWDTLGEQLQALVEHYSKTGIVSSVANDLKELFTNKDMDGWVAVPDLDYVGTQNGCFAKLMSIASSESEEFTKVIKKTKDEYQFDGIKRGLEGYIRDHYEELQFEVAYNLVKNGYTDENIEAYAETIQDGYVRDVMNDDKAGVTEYDTKKELSYLEREVDFYNRLDTLVAERTEKMQTIEKNDVGVKEPVKNIQKGKEQ